jgi:hypothetical protein
MKRELSKENTIKLQADATGDVAKQFISVKPLSQKVYRVHRKEKS